jgi:hypothetical protein
VIEAPRTVDVLAVRSIERDGRAGVAVDCAARCEAPVGLLDGGIRLATGNPKDFPMAEVVVEHWPAGA